MKPSLAILALLLAGCASPSPRAALTDKPLVHPALTYPFANDEGAIKIFVLKNRPEYLPTVYPTAKATNVMMLPLLKLTNAPTRLAAVPRFVPPSGIPMRLPPDATNYWWYLQESTDLHGWTFTPPVLPLDTVAIATNNAPMKFFRLYAVKLPWIP